MYQQFVLTRRLKSFILWVVGISLTNCMEMHKLVEIYQTAQSGGLTDRLSDKMLVWLKISACKLLFPDYRKVRADTKDYCKSVAYILKQHLNMLMDQHLSNIFNLHL